VSALVGYESTVFIRLVFGAGGRHNGYPDAIHRFIDVSAPDVEQFPTACMFNYQGSYLAVGCNTGRTFVWDCDTQGMARSFIGHCRAITSLRCGQGSRAKQCSPQNSHTCTCSNNSWSVDSHVLLTGSNDWTAVLWDVLTATVLHEVRCCSLVLGVEISPRNRSDDTCLSTPPTYHDRQCSRA